jgi:putative membrane protein
VTDPNNRQATWVRDHLANERTLLAWVRTSIAFMAFGLGIAKLSVLLAIDAMEHPEIAGSLPSARVSQTVGVLLVALGGLIAAVGAFQTRRWAREIAGDPPSAGPLIFTIGVAILMSVGLVFYLLA